MAGCTLPSIFKPTNKRYAPTAIRIPTRQHKIQSGKNEPAILKEGARSQPVRATIGASAKHGHFRLEIDLWAIGVMELSSEQGFAIHRLCETQDSQSVSIPEYVRICLLIGPAPGHAGLQQHQANFAAQDRTTSAPRHRICPPMPAVRPRLASGVALF